MTSPKWHSTVIKGKTVKSNIGGKLKNIIYKSYKEPN
jgi:hypothetical protein